MPPTKEDVHQFIRQHFGDEGLRDIFRLELNLHSYTVWSYHRNESGGIKSEMNGFRQPRPVVHFETHRYAS